MKIVIDTCSLMAMVRYYMPFDKDKVFQNFVKQKITDGELIVIDRVYDESRNISSGEIIRELAFLSDKEFLSLTKTPYKTDATLPLRPARFENMMNDQFVVQTQKSKLSVAEFQTLKEGFYNNADIKQILLCQNLINDGDCDVLLVTEETASNNDNKLFKKIPAICEFLEIETITLPKLIRKLGEVNVELKIEG